jgi:UDP-N-acetylglucosamine diphosphorylase/glucosamine-1-phosphate N-acetyltransferase
MILYDDAQARMLEPFATTRPAGELRAGALLTRERWSLVLDHPATGFLSAPHLTHFAEFDAPPAAFGEVPAGTWIVNARALPLVSLGLVQDETIIFLGDHVAAIRLTSPLPVSHFDNGAVSLDSLATDNAKRLSVEGVWLEHMWDVIRHLPMQLAQDIPVFAKHLSVSAKTFAPSPTMPHVIGDGGVFIDADVNIEPFTVFDTSNGPIFVRSGATIHAYTRLVGPCYVGKNSAVSTDRIAASSIGDMCRVHGELSTSVLIGHANKGHDGFVGHSILGRWVNLGAGTITSNLKNSYGMVSMWCPSGVQNTTMQFAGTLFGDHVKTGIGLRLSTGSVIGAGANLMDSMPPTVVAPFAWGTRAPYTTFEAAKFVETATRVMSRRNVTLDEAGRLFLSTVITHASRTSYWPR